MLVAHAASALAFRPRPGKPAIYAGVVIVLLALPAAAFAISTQSALTWIPSLTAEVFTGTLHALAGGRWAIAAVALAGAALLAGRIERWKAVLLIGWLVVPLAVVAALSIRNPLFLDRYLISVVPAASLCAAYLLTRAPGWWGAAAVAAACAWALGPVADWYRSPFKEDWRASAAYVDSRRAEGDHLTVTTEFLALVATYYMKSRPDSPVPRGNVTWVVTAAAVRDEVRADIRTRGFHIPEEKTFPGVVVLKAVRKTGTSRVATGRQGR